MVVLFGVGWWLLLLLHLQPSEAQVKYCTPPELGEGAWIRDNRKSKTYVCCAEGSEKDPVLKEFCPVGLFKDHACVCDEFHGTRLTVSEREKWAWKPSASCDMMEWNPSAFCDLLGTRKVLFVGDSTMHQTQGAFISMLNWGTNKTTCSSQLYHHRLDQFFDHGLDEFKKGFEIYGPDILVMGFGAHYTHRGLNFTPFNAHITNLLKVLIDIKRDHPNLQVVWKTNNPGHVACHDVKTVALTPPPTDVSKDRFFWRYFPEYDSIFNRISSSMNLDKEIHILNVKQLYLRPDSHPGRPATDWSNGDCLHFCAPGALDIIPILFAHSMLYNFTTALTNSSVHF